MQFRIADAQLVERRVQLAIRPVAGDGASTPARSFSMTCGIGNDRTLVSVCALLTTTRDGERWSDRG